MYEGPNSPALPSRRRPAERATGGVCVSCCFLDTVAQQRREGRPATPAAVRGSPSQTAHPLDNMLASNMIAARPVVALKRSTRSRTQPVRASSQQVNAVTSITTITEQEKALSKVDIKVWREPGVFFRGHTFFPPQEVEGPRSPVCEAEKSPRSMRLPGLTRGRSPAQSTAPRLLPVGPH